MSNKMTLVLGASLNPSRYSFTAIKKLRENGHDVSAIGRREGVVSDVQIETDWSVLEGLNTVTFYLNPSAQSEYLDYIIGLKPRRVIFNPGTENPSTYKIYEDAGVEVVEACTLVMLSTGQF